MPLKPYKFIVRAVLAEVQGGIPVREEITNEFVVYGPTLAKAAEKFDVELAEVLRSQSA